ncbi:hypothetical protein JCM6882_008285 [Rhodosporidiobolus microsporus]
MPRSLPVETVEEIISYLGPAELAQCCLVSRPFDAVARPLLWREIPIELVLDDRQMMAVASYQYSRMTWGILDALQQDEGLQGFPERAVFMEADEGGTKVLTTVDFALRSVAQLCPRLAAFSATHGDEAVFSDLVLRDVLEGRDVRSVDLGGLSERSWRAIKKLQPTLQDLAFSSPCKDDNADNLMRLSAMSPFTSLRLRSLLITHFSPYATDDPRSARKIFDRLTESSAATLRTLTIPFDLSITPSLHTFSALQHLTVTLPDDNTLPGRLDDLPIAVASAQTLRSLRIRVEYGARLSTKGVTALCKPTHEGLAQKLPASLQLFEIPVGPLPINLIILVTAIKAPKLHTLVFTRVQETLLGAMESFGGELAFSGFGELEELCRQRGINLVSGPGRGE